MTNPVPRYDDSLAFLKQWLPGGPWLLTAIGLDKTGIETRAFRAEQEAELRVWLAAQGVHRNLYFSVNTCFAEYLARADGTRSKKTEATDIEAMVCLHVDLDPREGEEPTKERERIKARLTTNLPQGVPPPTVVVFSGGGYQGFWLLREPVPLDGSKPAAEDAKRWNLQLEVLFGADRCHNIDRIMRLPGTINWPDGKKKAKGRTPALAEVVEWHPDRTYDIGQFTKAPEVQAAGAKDGAADVAQRVKVSGNVRRFDGDIDAVPGADKLPAKARVVIVQGSDPEEPHKHGSSRSEWLHFACCAMVRAGFADDTIYAVITDPRFGISASVLDKGSATEKYAIRQIERARAEEPEQPEDGNVVAKINRGYFAATEGGKLTFYREEDDGSVEHMTGEVFDFELAPVKAAFKTVNAKGEESVKVLPASRVWRESPDRRYYRRGMILQPEGTVPDGYYNLWRGFGVQPAPGDWSLLREHVLNILAGGSEEYADYIENWTAWSLQNPATPPRVALVFRGLEGTGKGLFGNALCRVFGRHGQRLQSMQQVAGRFNSHFRHCCLLFADEATVVGDEGEGALKGIITEPTLPIEGKGKDIVHARNHLHVVMASNREWVVPAGIGSRRFAIFDVSSARKGDKPYFDALFAQTRDDGLGAMLHDLLSKRLDGWHPEAHRPDTAAQADQVRRGLRGVERAFFDCLCSGTLPCGHVVPKGHRRKPNGSARAEGSVHVPTVQLQDAWAIRFREVIATQSIADLFKKLGFVSRETRPRGWEVSPLSVARERWTEHFKWRGWDAASTWAVTAQTPDAEGRGGAGDLGEPATPF